MKGGSEMIEKVIKFKLKETEICINDIVEIDYYYDTFTNIRTWGRITDITEKFMILDTSKRFRRGLEIIENNFITNVKCIEKGIDDSISDDINDCITPTESHTSSWQAKNKL